jgi:hypothetical protein
MDRRGHLALLAAAHKVPATYPWRDFVEAGGPGPHIALLVPAGSDARLPFPSRLSLLCVKRRQGAGAGREGHTGGRDSFRQPRRRSPSPVARGHQHWEHNAAISERREEISAGTFCESDCVSKQSSVSSTHFGYTDGGVCAPTVLLELSHRFQT